MPRNPKPVSEQASTTGLSIRIHPDTLAVLDELAKADRRPRAAEVATLVELWLDDIPADTELHPLVTEEPSVRILVHPGFDVITKIDARFGLARGLREAAVIAAIAWHTDDTGTPVDKKRRDRRRKSVAAR